MHRETASPISLGQHYPQAEKPEQRRSNSQEGMAAFTMLMLAPDKENRDGGHSTSVGSKHLRALTQILFKFVHQRNQDFKYQSIPKQEYIGKGDLFLFFFLGCLRDFPG